MSEVEAEQTLAQLTLERLYLKDASFESPGSPGVFTEQFRPEMQVDINTKVNGLGENRHEVVLATTVTARLDENRTIYIIEVQQAGIFSITGVEGNALRQVLGIACPNTLFPYLREVIDNLVVKGGFQPLQLAPVNFEMLFNQAMAQAQAQAEEKQQGGSGAGNLPVVDDGPDIKH